MRCIRRAFRQRLAREIADISVGRELHPGPAFVILIEHQLFAVDGLGRDRGRMRGLATQVREAVTYVPALPLDVAGSLDLAAQMRGCEIGARRGEARVVLHVRISADSRLACARLSMRS